MRRCGARSRGGHHGITRRLVRAIKDSVAEGLRTIDNSPTEVAQSLYQLWLGASVMVKIVHDTQPFATAMATTRHILHLTL